MAWVEQFVIAHGLCPFAARPWKAGRVQAATIEAPDVEAAFYAALTQVQGFVERSDRDVETLLLVLPQHLESFYVFLDFLYTFEGTLEETGANAVVQLAHFHPEYQFANVPADDPGNRTNRSPHPVIQLLRVDSVAKAVAAYPDTDMIPERNIEKMKKLAL